MTWRDTRQNQKRAYSLTNAERQKKWREEHKTEAREASAERQKRFRDKRKGEADKPDAAKVQRMQDRLNAMIPKSMRGKTKTDIEHRMQETLSALKTAFDELMTASSTVDRARIIGSIVALDNLLESDAART